MSPVLFIRVHDGPHVHIVNADHIERMTPLPGARPEDDRVSLFFASGRWLVVCETLDQILSQIPEPE